MRPDVVQFAYIKSVLRWSSRSLLNHEPKRQTSFDSAALRERSEQVDYRLFVLFRFVLLVRPERTEELSPILSCLKTQEMPIMRLSFSSKFYRSSFISRWFLFQSLMILPFSQDRVVSPKLYHLFFNRSRCYPIIYNLRKISSAVCSVVTSTLFLIQTLLYSIFYSSFLRLVFNFQKKFSLFSLLESDNFSFSIDYCFFLSVNSLNYSLDRIVNLNFGLSSINFLTSFRIFSSLCSEVLLNLTQVGLSGACSRYRYSCRGDIL